MDKRWTPFALENIYFDTINQHKVVEGKIVDFFMEVVENTEVK